MQRQKRVRSLKGMAAEADAMNELIVGISWCEHPIGGSPNHSTVDLDLSVVCYDESWKRLAFCSYTNTNEKGMTHSGDLTFAPHPKGAREDVRIILDQLVEGTRYVCLCVLNYTGQPMEECCADASVFVASTLPGLGPGVSELLRCLGSFEWRVC